MARPIAAAVAVVVAILSSRVAERVAEAQPQPLDKGTMAGGPVEAEPPLIELLTFGVGERIFEKWGHAAICIRYHNPRISAVCFNYGVTNFRDAGAGMVWRFLRNEQQFWVEPSTYGAMVNFYKWEDRDIWSQILPLGPDDARAVEKELWDSLDDARRFYLYDHFRDNCATRVRDIADRAVHGKLHEGADDIAYPLTYRQIGVGGLAPWPLLVGLTDFIIGHTVDDTPSLWEAMFQPSVLRAQIESKLGVAPRLVYARRGPGFEHAGSSWRVEMVLIALGFAMPLAIAALLRRFIRIGLAWAAVYLTLWGLVVWGLAVVSSIPGIRWNELVLVFVPLDVVLPILGEVRRHRYARIRVAMLAGVSALAAIGVFHQPVWVPVLCAFVPLAIAAFATSRPRYAGGTNA